MDEVEEEVKARLVLAGLKKKGALRRQAEGVWGRGVAVFLLFAGFAAGFLFPNGGFMVVLTALAGAVIGLLFELHWANRRIDALLAMQIQLEERLEKTEGAPVKEREEG